MRKLIVNEWMSLDGVVQAPMYPDEDPSGGFAHGGWHQKYFDDVARKWTVDNITGAGGFLVGGRADSCSGGGRMRCSQPIGRGRKQRCRSSRSLSTSGRSSWRRERSKGRSRGRARG